MIPEQTLLGYPLFGDNATKVEPDNNKKSNGWQQGDVVPAEWMNWAWYHNSKGVADLNKGVNSIEKEINNVLSSFGISPAEATNNQLLTAMRLNASFVTAASTTITGPLLVSGGTIRVMFTQDITGSDTTTGLTVNYNGATKAVKVSKDGVLTALTAHEITTNVFKYIQKYTPLELYYDGVDFIIMGNPLVLSGTNYKIYADGDFTEILWDRGRTVQGNKMIQWGKAVVGTQYTVAMHYEFADNNYIVYATPLATAWNQLNDMSCVLPLNTNVFQCFGATEGRYVYYYAIGNKRS